MKAGLMSGFLFLMLEVLFLLAPAPTGMALRNPFKIVYPTQLCNKVFNNKIPQQTRVPGGVFRARVSDVK